MRRQSARVYPIASGVKSRLSNGGSILSFRRPSFGDKIQRLVLVAPAYARAVEYLVDQMLKTINA